ncbi:MAG: site-specific integrase [Prevotella sp.]|nr:site-specific integrase [Prevotella sp.]
MSETRKDSKGRRLWNGETQDADGRYKYRYTDLNGNRVTVYSWRLTEADHVPSGKRQDSSLREKEKEIKQMLDMKLDVSKSNVTLLELARRYIQSKPGYKPVTVHQYETSIDRVEGSPFLQRKINDVRTSEAKAWCVGLAKDGVPGEIIDRVKTILKLAYKMAIEDEIAVRNPFDFSLSDVVRYTVNTRDAITPEQEKALLDFLKEDTCYKKYYEPVYILFKTGMRISEFCGLTMDDIDLENGRININHQVLKVPNKGMFVGPPKSKSGYRIIPMSDSVKECFERIIQRREKFDNEPVLYDDDGKAYTGFLYLNRRGNVLISADWEQRFNDIVGRYNKKHEVHLPKITPHVARHTFCTNMANSGVPPKQLQYIMGHSTITITMDHYTHTHVDDLGNIMENVCRI